MGNVGESPFGAVPEAQHAGARVKEASKRGVIPDWD